MVTANSDWSTFDTIGGYRPEKDGELSFNSGIFLDCFKDKETDKPQNKWLIIDEINRADIDKAFGSLFSALTGDAIKLSFKADNRENIQVRPQGGNEDSIVPQEEEYVIPRDWRLIATMNTYDKTSLYEMSYAFMRRFAFIPVSVPQNINAELIKNYLGYWKIEEPVGESYAENVAQLWKLINKYRKIGPALVEDIYNYLIETEGDYASAISMYVLPQFKGLLEDELSKFVKNVTSLDFITHEKMVSSFAEDYFRLENLSNED